MTRQDNDPGGTEQRRVRDEVKERAREREEEARRRRQRERRLRDAGMGGAGLAGGAVLGHRASELLDDGEEAAGDSTDAESLPESASLDVFGPPDVDDSEERELLPTGTVSTGEKAIPDIDIPEPVFDVPAIQEQPPDEPEIPDFPVPSTDERDGEPAQPGAPGDSAEPPPLGSAPSSRPDSPSPPPVPQPPPTAAGRPAMPPSSSPPQSPPPPSVDVPPPPEAVPFAPLPIISGPSEEPDISPETGIPEAPAPADDGPANAAPPPVGTPGDIPPPVDSAPPPAETAPPADEATAPPDEAGPPDQAPATPPVDQPGTGPADDDEDVVIDVEPGGAPDTEEPPAGPPTDQDEDEPVDTQPDGGDQAVPPEDEEPPATPPPLDEDDIEPPPGEPDYGEVEYYFENLFGPAYAHPEDLGYEPVATDSSEIMEGTVNVAFYENGALVISWPDGRQTISWVTDQEGNPYAFGPDASVEMIQAPEFEENYHAHFEIEISPDGETTIENYPVDYAIEHYNRIVDITLEGYEHYPDPAETGMEIVDVEVDGQVVSLTYEDGTIKNIWRGGGYLEDQSLIEIIYPDGTRIRDTLTGDQSLEDAGTGDYEPPVVEDEGEESLDDLLAGWEESELFFPNAIGYVGIAGDVSVDPHSLIDQLGDPEIIEGDGYYDLVWTLDQTDSDTTLTQRLWNDGSGRVSLEFEDWVRATWIDGEPTVEIYAYGGWQQTIWVEELGVYYYAIPDPHTGELMLAHIDPATNTFAPAVLTEAGDNVAPAVYDAQSGTWVEAVWDLSAGEYVPVDQAVEPAEWDHISGEWVPVEEVGPPDLDEGEAEEEAELGEEAPAYLDTEGLYANPALDGEPVSVITGVTEDDYPAYPLRYLFTPNNAPGVQAESVAFYDNGVIVVTFDDGSYEAAYLVNAQGERIPFDAGSDLSSLANGVYLEYSAYVAADGTLDTGYSSPYHLDDIEIEVDGLDLPDLAGYEDQWGDPQYAAFTVTRTLELPDGTTVTQEIPRNSAWMTYEFQPQGIQVKFDQYNPSYSRVFFEDPESGYWQQIRWDSEHEVWVRDPTLYADEGDKSYFVWDDEAQQFVPAVGDAAPPPSYAESAIPEDTFLPELLDPTHPDTLLVRYPDGTLHEFGRDEDGSHYHYLIDEETGVATRITGNDPFLDSLDPPALNFGETSHIFQPDGTLLVGHGNPNQDWIVESVDAERGIVVTRTDAPDGRMREYDLDGATTYETIVYPDGTRGERVMSGLRLLGVDEASGSAIFLDDDGNVIRFDASGTKTYLAIGEQELDAWYWNLTGYEVAGDAEHFVWQDDGWVSVDEAAEPAAAPPSYAESPIPDETYLPELLEPVHPDTLLVRYPDGTLHEFGYRNDGSRYHYLINEETGVATDLTNGDPYLVSLDPPTLEINETDHVFQPDGTLGQVLDTPNPRWMVESVDAEQGIVRVHTDSPGVLREYDLDGEVTYVSYVYPDGTRSEREVSNDLHLLGIDEASGSATFLNDDGEIVRYDASGTEMMLALSSDSILDYEVPENPNTYIWEENGWVGYDPDEHIDGEEVTPDEPEGEADEVAEGTTQPEEPSAEIRYLGPNGTYPHPEDLGMTGTPIEGSLNSGIHIEGMVAYPDGSLVSTAEDGTQTIMWIVDYAGSPYVIQSLSHFETTMSAMATGDTGLYLAYGVQVPAEGEVSVIAHTVESVERVVTFDGLDLTDPEADPQFGEPDEINIGIRTVEKIWYTDAGPITKEIVRSDSSFLVGNDPNVPDYDVGTVTITYPNGIRVVDFNGSKLYYQQDASGEWQAVNPADLDLAGPDESGDMDTDTSGEDAGDESTMQTTAAPSQDQTTTDEASPEEQPVAGDQVDAEGDSAQSKDGEAAEPDGGEGDGVTDMEPLDFSVEDSGTDEAEFDDDSSTGEQVDADVSVEEPAAEIPAEQPTDVPQADLDQPEDLTAEEEPEEVADDDIDDGAP